ncbi:MAG: hypothetical protein AAB038_03470 [Planctomycetota bacterium]
MKELKVIGSPLIRIKQINFSVGENVVFGSVQLKIEIESHKIGISPDGQNIIMGITIKISEPDKKVSGEFQMECVLRLEKSISPEEFVNEKDMSIMEKNIRYFLGMMFDQMSLSVSTIVAQFGLGPINLSKILQLENIKITYPVVASSNGINPGNVYTTKICPSCGKEFNGAIYKENCPHCQARLYT